MSTVCFQKKRLTSFKKMVFLIFVFITFAKIPLFSEENRNECDVNYVKEFLKRAEDSYNFVEGSTEPFQLTIDYYGVDFENNIITAKITLYWENQNKWREEFDSGNCKSILICLDGVRYMPKDQQFLSNICPAFITTEPLDLHKKFNISEEDKINCSLNKLPDGTEVLDVFVNSPLSLYKKDKEKNKKKHSDELPYFSRAFRFEKSTGFLLQENIGNNDGYLETFKCQTMNGKIFPTIIRKISNYKFSAEWKLTNFVLPAKLNPNLFNIENGSFIPIISVALINPPKLVKDCPPRFPKEALVLGLNGTVIVEVLINPNGDVVDAKILESTSYIFNRAVLAAAFKWKFLSPTDKTGAKQYCYLIRKVVFRSR